MFFFIWRYPFDFNEYCVFFVITKYGWCQNCMKTKFFVFLFSSVNLVTDNKHKKFDIFLYRLIISKKYKYDLYTILTSVKLSLVDCLIGNQYHIFLLVYYMQKLLFKLVANSWNCSSMCILLHKLQIMFSVYRTFSCICILLYYSMCVLPKKIISVLFQTYLAVLKKKN